MVNRQIRQVGESELRDDKACRFEITESSSTASPVATRTRNFRALIAMRAIRSGAP